jgi:uncharacterized protein YndB with AHSA1/START domain
VPDVLTMQARLAAPPAAVYGALTEPTAMRVWLAEHAEISLPQRRFEFWGRFTPQGERGRQALIAAEQDRSLDFTWTLDGEHTAVAIRLEPYGTDHTTVRLRQDGLPTLEELMAPPGRRDGLHAMHTFWGLALSGELVA